MMMIGRSRNCTHGPRGSVRAQGSVLVFAIVILSILTVLGVSFLLLAQHAVQSAKVGVTSYQPVAAADAGLYRAQKFLNTSVRGVYTSTPEGVVKLDYTNNPLGELSLVPSTGATHGAAFNSTFGMFEHNLQFTATTPTFAVLSSRYPDAVFPLTPYYTSAPMRLNALPPDRAAVYYMRSDNTDFYTLPTGTRKALSPSGTIRAKSYQWVRDLDANFCVNPALWGININGVPNAPKDAGVVVGNILNTLLANSDLKGTFSDQDIAYMSQLTPNVHLDSVQAMAQGFPTYELYTQGKITPETYEFWRSDLECYFTPFVDALDANNNFVLNEAGGLISQFKPAPAAININTAPVEVIQAMLSQIPDGLNGTLGSTGKGLLIARRIVAKRPFLCRMEFEDFAASLLPGDAADLTSDAGLRTPLGMINYALQRRIDNTNNLNHPGQNELPLASYLEIPGILEDNAIYKNANTTQRMAQRFAFFMDDTSGLMIPNVTPNRNDCTISVKTFNNLLNSVSANSNSAQQYVVSMLPGQTGAPKAPVLAPFTGYTLDGIMLGGDDTIETDASGHQYVSSGPNGIAETAVFGYSYYSFDAQSLPQFYKPVLETSKDGTPLFNAQQLQDPAAMGKFIYGDPQHFDDATPPKGFAPANALYKNYLIGDLQRWSCVGDGKRSGYYEMWFNGNDVMLLELGEQSNQDIPDPTEVVIQSIDPTQMLRTVVTNPLVRDDVQEYAFGDTIDQGDPIVFPGPNLALETSVTVLDKITKLRKGDDQIVNAIRLAQDNSSPPDAYFAAFDAGTTTDVFYPFNPDYNYIIPGIGTGADGKPIVLPLQTTVQAQANPDDKDVLISIIIDGGNGTVETSVPDDVLDSTGATIQIGENFINDSFVWGPLRASQRPLDQQMPLNADETPSATRTSGNGLGDVAWGPPIAFRSRFFTTYVLAQGLNTHPALTGTSICSAQPGSNGPLTFTWSPTADSDGNLPTTIPPENVAPGTLIAVATTVASRKDVYVIDSASIAGLNATITLATPLTEAFSGPAATAIYTFSVLGEHRIESAYDAYNDEVLSRHSPLTDKRSLGDP